MHNRTKIGRTTPVTAIADTRIALGSDSVEDYLIAQFCDQRINDNLHTVSKKTDINADKTELKKWLMQHFVIVEPHYKISFGINQERDMMFSISDRSWAIRVTVTGDPEKVDQTIKLLEKTFDTNPCYIRWVYDPQYMEDMTMPINHANQPLIEMYPFMEESLESYYDRFLNSSANILVMLGVPGSGKTTMIRGMLSHTKKSATLTYHEKILQQDAFFVNWLQSKDTFLVIEDADTLLLPRSDGNDLMARFLNMGDGLMGFKNKKIVFSTNLSNVSDIDDALTRPGRCFDILKFRSLERYEATILAEKIGVELPDGNQFTVSEIFAAKRNETKPKRKSTFGFI